MISCVSLSLSLCDVCACACVSRSLASLFVSCACVRSSQQCTGQQAAVAANADAEEVPTLAAERRGSDFGTAIASELAPASAMVGVDDVLERQQQPLAPAAEAAASLKASAASISPPDATHADAEQVFILDGLEHVDRDRAQLFLGTNCLRSLYDSPERTVALSWTDSDGELRALALGRFEDAAYRRFELRGFKVVQTLRRRGLGGQLLSALCGRILERSDSSQVELSIPPTGQCHRDLRSLLLFKKRLNAHVTVGGAPVSLRALEDMVKAAEQRGVGFRRDDAHVVFEPLRRDTGGNTAAIASESVGEAASAHPADLQMAATRAEMGWGVDDELSPRQLRPGRNLLIYPYAHGEKPSAPSRAQDGHNSAGRLVDSEAGHSFGSDRTNTSRRGGQISEKAHCHGCPDRRQGPTPRTSSRSD